MRISDWSSDVCSSDLTRRGVCHGPVVLPLFTAVKPDKTKKPRHRAGALPLYCFVYSELLGQLRHDLEEIANQTEVRNLKNRRILILVDGDDGLGVLHAGKMLDRAGYRSEEHTSEIQSLMRISYAV